MPTDGPKRELRELTSPLARELAEYTILRNDLHDSFQMMKLWFEKYAGQQDNQTAEERLIALSLFRESIILFVGCFDESARTHLSASDIYKDEDGGMVFFQWLKDIRDTYAAHKFGPLRQCVVGVILDDSGRLIGTGHQHQLFAGPVAEQKASLLSFIRLADPFLKAKIKEIGKQLVEAVNAMTPAELANLKIARTHPVDAPKIRTSRESFLRSISKRDDG